MGVHRNCFQNFWSPSGWSGWSRMSKNWGFRGFWVSWWGFCHCTPTYDTFLKSLGPWEWPWMVSRIFWLIYEDQDGQKCPKTGDLGDWGRIDWVFVIVTPHMISFWNPWNIESCLDCFSGCSGTNRCKRVVKIVPKLGNLGNLGDFYECFVSVNPHMISFWNPCNPWSCLDWFSEFLGTILSISMVKIFKS